MPNVDGFLKFQRSLIVTEDLYKQRVRGAFKRSRRSLVGITADLGLESPFLVPSISGEFDKLKAEVDQISREFEPTVIDRTAKWANRQLIDARSVGVPAPTLDLLGDPEEITAMIIGSVDVFRGRVISTLPRLTSEDLQDALEMLYHEEDQFKGRVSIYKTSLNTAEMDVGGAVWGLSNNYMNDIFGMLGAMQPLQRWMRQIIAAVDERTTECCLFAHGQIQPENEPFVLIGEPRFNDEQMNAPFHWNCRTGVALYLKQFEGIGVTTGQMEGASYDELVAREVSGKRIEIHPAHATSGR